MTSSTQGTITGYLPRALIWIGNVFVYYTCKTVRITYKYVINCHMNFHVLLNASHNSSHAHPHPRLCSVRNNRSIQLGVKYTPCPFNWAEIRALCVWKFPRSVREWHLAEARSSSATFCQEYWNIHHLLSPLWQSNTSFYSNGILSGHRLLVYVYKLAHVMNMDEILFNYNLTYFQDKH